MSDNLDYCTLQSNFREQKSQNHFSVTFSISVKGRQYLLKIEVNILLTILENM